MHPVRKRGLKSIAKLILILAASVYSFYLGTVIGKTFSTTDKTTSDINK